MPILNRMAKGAFTTALLIARHTDPRAVTYPVQQIAAAVPLPAISFPVWDVKQQEMLIDVQTTDPADSLTSRFFTIDAAVSASRFLADAFIQGQQEKQSRAENIFSPIVNEIKQKSTELLDASPSQQQDMKERFRAIRSEHNETEKQLKQAEKSISFLSKCVDTELKQVLQQKIDPKTVDAFCKLIKVSSKVALSTIPALRVFSQLSTAYETAKVLYPEQTAQLEHYIVDQLQGQFKAAQQVMASVAEMSPVPSSPTYGRG
jgi:hypothetical protein